MNCTIFVVILHVFLNLSVDLFRYCPPTVAHVHKYLSYLVIFASFSLFPQKTPQALFTASKFCLFDVLHNKPGLDAELIAQEIKASVKGTETLLEACVSLGLLKTEASS